MLYGSNGAAFSNMPKNTIVMNVQANGATINNTTLFVNTTPGAAYQNAVIGVYGVTAKQANLAGNTYNQKNVAPGWVLRKSGLGPVTGFTYSNHGTGYSNNDLVKVTGNGCINTVANVTTNSIGAVVSLNNFTVGGGLFPNSSFCTVAISNTTGGAANGTLFSATAVLGGRAGRVQNEVLVVMSSMTSNSTYNPAAFPSS